MDISSEVESSESRTQEARSSFGVVQGCGGGRTGGEVEKG